MSKMHVNHSHVANGGLRKNYTLWQHQEQNSSFFFSACEKIFFRPVQITFRLVDVRYSSSKGQAVKQTFFAPCSRIN